MDIRGRDAFSHGFEEWPVPTFMLKVEQPAAPLQPETIRLPRRPNARQRRRMRHIARRHR